jgi:NADP-dependent 3-hydroxy acid dehydrogenase YdfG
VNAFTANPGPPTADRHSVLMPQSPLERLKIDEWNRMIDVNIKGVLYGIAAALPYMKEQKAGHIINVSSVAGHKVGPGFAVYSATKYAVRALSEGLRQEVKPCRKKDPGKSA